MSYGFIGTSDEERKAFEVIVEVMKALGYRFEEDEREVRIWRPDGSLAIRATKARVH